VAVGSEAAAVHQWEAVGPAVVRLPEEPAVAEAVADKQTQKQTKASVTCKLSVAS